MIDFTLSNLAARRFAPLLFSAACGLVLTACDDSAQKEAEAKAVAEAKAAEEAQQKKADELRLKREAADKLEAEAEAVRQAQIDALAVLPAKFPKKLDKVCQEVGVAQNAFMDRVYADEPETLEKWKANPSATQMIVATCTKGGSVEAAACQINALNEAPADFKKTFPELLSACNQKFAVGGAATPPA